MELLLLLAVSLLTLVSAIACSALAYLKMSPKPDPQELKMRLNRNEPEDDDDRATEALAKNAEVPVNVDSLGHDKPLKLSICVGESSSMDDLLSRIASKSRDTSCPVSIRELKSMAVHYTTKKGDVRLLRSGASWMYCVEVLGDASNIALSRTKEHIGHEGDGGDGDGMGLGKGNIWKVGSRQERVDETTPVLPTSLDCLSHNCFTNGEARARSSEVANFDQGTVHHVRKGKHVKSYVQLK